QVVEVPLLGLLADRLGDLALEVRVGVHDVPALGHGFSPRLHQLPSPSTKVISARMIWSAMRKKTEATATMTNTMAVVMAVSRRVGHVTFCTSERTSWQDLTGLTLALMLSLRRMSRLVPPFE